MKINLAQSVFLAAFVLAGLYVGAAPAVMLVIFGDSVSLALLVITAAALAGWGFGKLLLMLINLAVVDPQGRLLDRRGRVICERPGHPLAFSLRTLFVLSALSAIAAALAREIWQSGGLNSVMSFATPLFALVGGFLWLYAKRRGARCGLLVLLGTMGTMLVWFMVARVIPLPAHYRPMMDM